MAKSTSPTASSSSTGSSVADNSRRRRGQHLRFAGSIRVQRVPWVIWDAKCIQGVNERITSGPGQRVLTTLHSFQWGDGAYPNVLIRAADSNFYSATSEGGDLSRGTIFRLDVS